MRGMDFRRHPPTPTVDPLLDSGSIREAHLWRCAEWKTAEATPTEAPAKGAGET
jgi:hypothetical protein